MTTTVIHWQPSALYVFSRPHVQIERRASWNGIGAFAFDDLVSEGMDFGCSFPAQWGKKISVELWFSEDRSSAVGVSQWEVEINGNKKGQWKSEGRTVAHRNARIIVESFEFDVSAFTAGDPLVIVVWRLPYEATDTLVGDALLCAVKAEGGEP